MATTEIFAIVGIVVAAAIFVPILFDENPGAFLENALCTIFTPGSGTNTTCNAIKGNVTFIGDFPIIITANNSANEVTWSFGQLGNASHSNIGGGAEVFKNETGGLANLRTLVGSGGVSVTEDSETITITTGGGGPTPLSNINNGSGQVFSSSSEGDTVTFVGQGIAISNVSSVTFSLNATADELLDVDYPTPPDEDQILVFNVTTMMWENEPIGSAIALFDVHFNAEEATVDDIVGITCLNDVTYSFFDNLDIHEYRRQAVEFCPDSEPDDNITWLYTVPRDYSTATDFKFKLFWTDDDTGSGAFVKRVIADNDDAEQSNVSGPMTPGDMSLTSSDLELHNENIIEHGANDNDHHGMRWTDVIVPNAATIINATIQYHVDQTSTGSDQVLVVRYRGEDVDSASTYTNTDFDLTDRTQTTAFVDWSVPTWVSVSDEGPAQLTPNLATIVQEIVDRPGWLSGNDMNIMITDWPNGTGTNIGARWAESFDGESASAPELNISFTTGGGGPSPVCFEISIMAIANTEVMDGLFSARDTVCVNRSGTDNLSVTEFIVEEADHQFSAEDLVFLRINRPNDFVVNDFESEVFVFGGELQWLN